MTDVKESTEFPQREDNYALDDTLAGRLAQAGLVAVYAAVPDYASGWSRRIARLGVVAAGIAAIAIANAYEEDEQETAEAEHLTPEDKELPVGVAAAGLTVAVGGHWVDRQLEKALGTALRKRGVARPHTLMGVVVGAGVFAVSEVAARRHRRGA